MMSAGLMGPSLIPLFVVWAGATVVQDSAQALRDGACAGRVEAVRELLASGAPDLVSADGTGRTALMCAVEGGHDAIVELLLKAGASLAARNQSGETALHLAARHGRTASARLLLRAGADYELQDSEGRTPLYRAIEARRAPIIEMLQGAALAKGKGAPSLTTSESPDQALPPTVVESKPAPYTETALAEKVEGTVVLMVLVRRDGSVGAATVSKGLDASLDRSALSTVREWKFAPAMRKGKTVEVVLEVKMEFRLPAEP